MTSETNIVQECRLAASECGAIVWRNNTGALKDQNGRLVRYGLCPGSSDLIGIYKSKFVALEVKIPGKKPRPEQVTFINAVIANGGIAGVVTNRADVYALLK